jgi:hypothetical protein
MGELKSQLELADIGEYPEGKFLSRRIAKDGYSPDNCYWGDWIDRLKVTARVILLEADGKKQSQEAWCRELGTTHKTIAKWRKTGTSFQKFVEAQRGKRSI